MYCAKSMRNGDLCCGERRGSKLRNEHFISMTCGEASETSLESLDQLRELVRVFEQHNISYWLDSGTLLGVIREGRMLPSDHDIDISIWQQSSVNLKTLLRTLADRKSVV